MRGGIRTGALFSAGFSAGAALSLACNGEAAARAKPAIAVTVETVKQAIESKNGSVQLVTFPETGWGAVKIVRGSSTGRNKSGQKPVPEKAEIAEVASFDDPQRKPVRILRGDAEHGFGIPGQVRPAGPMAMQVVTFANLQDRPVSILRGAGFQAVETGLFRPALATDLDRVAFLQIGQERIGHGASVEMGRGRRSLSELGFADLMVGDPQGEQLGLLGPDSRRRRPYQHQKKEHPCQHFPLQLGIPSPSLVMTGPVRHDS